MVGSLFVPVGNMWEPCELVVDTYNRLVSVSRRARNYRELDSCPHNWLKQKRFATRLIIETIIDNDASHRWNIRLTIRLTRRSHSLRVKRIIRRESLLLMQLLPIGWTLTDRKRCTRWRYKVHRLLRLK